MTRVSHPLHSLACPRVRHRTAAGWLRGTLAGLLGLALLVQAAPLAQAGVNDEFKRSRQGDIIRGASKLPAAPVQQQAFLANSAAPSFAISGRLRELAQVKLADTPLGPISALDVLMQDAMSEQRLVRAPVDALLTPTSLKAEPLQPYLRSVVNQIVANAALAATQGNWQPQEDEVRAMALDGAIAAYIEQNVKDQVKVLDADIDRYYLAHPELYLRRSRAQVRYIYIPSSLTDGDAGLAASHKMEDLERRVRKGELDFAAAARENSAAPSAAEGGLLPPFYNGTYFPEFERQVFSLAKPGEISEIFRGPGGIYLVQLVQSWAPANIPIDAVSDEIRTTLQAEHVKHYYIVELAKLREKHWNRNNSVFWEYMDLDAPIAQVGKQRLERADFLRYFSNPTDQGYQVLWPQVLTPAAHWLEGETVMQGLERAGQTEHPYLVRARELATMQLRARRALSLAVPAAEVNTTPLALAVLDRNPNFRRNLRQARVLRLEIIPKTLELAPSEQRAAVRLAETLANQVHEGTLPAATPLELKQWQAENVTTGTLDLTKAIDDLQHAAKEASWPHIGFTAVDLGWQPVVPGTPWATALLNVGPGEVSVPQLVGETQTLYLVLAQLPVSPESWGEKPLYLQNMARAALIIEKAVAAQRKAAPSVKMVF